jgi:hypothetical protein
MNLEFPSTSLSSPEAAGSAVMHRGREGVDVRRSGFERYGVSRLRSRATFLHRSTCRGRGGRFGSKRTTRPWPTFSRYSALQPDFPMRANSLYAVLPSFVPTLLRSTTAPNDDCARGHATELLRMTRSRAEYSTTTSSISFGKTIQSPASTRSRGWADQSQVVGESDIFKSSYSRTRDDSCNVARRVRLNGLDAASARRTMASS